MGANVAQQFLKLGLIDEISIHLVPVLFGSGTRLFEGLDSEHIPLETIEVIQTPRRSTTALPCLIISAIRKDAVGSAQFALEKVI